MIPIQVRIPGREITHARGIAITRKGFRPLFLLAATYAFAIVPLWLLVLTAHTVVPSSFAPVNWHGHEMVFGYTAAVIAGFLLTAVARWTSRETAVGAWLATLCVLWLLGRVAMWLPWPAWVVALADMAFLPAVAVAVGPAIVLSNNRRNYGVLALLVLLALANTLTHLDALGIAPGWGRRGLLLGVDLVVLMMLVITGRVVPMFTRNATGVEAIRTLPALEVSTMVVAVLSTFTNLAFGASLATAVFSGAAGVLVLARTRHWGSIASLRHPMLWILHAGHCWIAIGFLLRGASSLLPALGSSATHAFTAGAIGSLTIGMMSRVALGHTGRPIEASQLTRLAFFAITIAGVLRVCGPLQPNRYLALLTAAGTFWSLAFALFVFEYASILVRPRFDGAPD